MTLNLELLIFTFLNGTAQVVEANQSNYYLSELFNQPKFYERKVMLSHMMVILIAFDEMNNISLLHSICSNLSAFYFDSKLKNHDY